MTFVSILRLQARLNSQVIFEDIKNFKKNFILLINCLKTYFKAQENVYKSLGVDIINNAFDGYNACIFAYGQTGSGKSYTMTGSSDNKGLIPRICEGIFERIAQIEAEKKASNEEDSNEVAFRIEASYIEIYNEKVQDLLDPKGVKKNLKVREHQLLGPYIDGLSQLAVTSYKV